MPTKKENLQHLFIRKSQTSNKKIASSAAPKLAITAQTSGREDLRKLGENRYSSAENTVYYDTTGGSAFDGEAETNLYRGQQNPAVVFIHELKHGQDDMVLGTFVQDDKDTFKGDGNNEDIWKNCAEQNAVFLENAVCKELQAKGFTDGTTPRPSYTGKPYKTTGSTTAKAKNPNDLMLVPKK